MVIIIFYLMLWFSTVGDRALQVTFGNLWRDLWLWAEVGNVAKHHTVPRVATRSKDYLIQNVNSAEVEKLKLVKNSKFFEFLSIF